MRRARSERHELPRAGQDYIFHSAADSHHEPVRPFPDIDINIKGTAVLLEACKRHNRGARIVKLGTRGQYGPSVRLPVAEDAPMNPKGIYEVSLLAAEKIAQIYHDVHGIQTTPLRLTNIYGRFTKMRHSRFGSPTGSSVSRSTQTIKVFGDRRLTATFVISMTVSPRSCLPPVRRGGSQVLNVGNDNPSCSRARRDGGAGRRPRHGSSPRSPPSAPRRSRATYPTSAVSAR